MTKLIAKNLQKILLIKPSSLGDCIQALPVLNALRHAVPKAKIFWLVNREYAQLLAHHHALQGLILFDRDRFRLASFGVGQIREAVAFWAKLRAERFDLVIDLQGLFRSALMARATAAKVRLGLSDAREWAELFYSHIVELGPGDIHAVDRYMRVLDRLGVDSRRRDFSLPVSSESLARVNEMLDRTALNASEDFVLIFPGARWESKRWGTDRFAGLIDRIADELSLPSVLAGAGGEVELSRRVAGLCGSKPVDLTGRTSLSELAALISCSRLVVGHDSGTIHLAAALRRPLICLIGPTDAKRTGPYGLEESIVSTGLACAPCRRVVCPGNECMRLISVESVFRKVKAILSAKA